MEDDGATWRRVVRVVRYRRRFGEITGRTNGVVRCGGARRPPIQDMHECAPGNSRRDPNTHARTMLRASITCDEVRRDAILALLKRQLTRDACPNACAVRRSKMTGRPSRGNRCVSGRAMAVGRALRHKALLERPCNWSGRASRSPRRHAGCSERHVHGTSPLMQGANSACFVNDVMALTKRQFDD